MGGAGESTAGVVCAATGLVQDDFILAITVEVADRGIVGLIALGHLQWDTQVGLSPGLGRD